MNSDVPIHGRTVKRLVRSFRFYARSDLPSGIPEFSIVLGIHRREPQHQPHEFDLAHPLTRGAHRSICAQLAPLAQGSLGLFLEEDPKEKLGIVTELAPRVLW